MITTTEEKSIQQTASRITSTTDLKKTSIQNNHDDDLDRDDWLGQDGISVTPLNIPLERRLQMGSVIAWLASSFSLLSLFLWLCTSRYWLPLALMYLIYAFLDRAPEKGGRPFWWVRQWALWKHIVDYFPIRLVKEQDLDPSKKYLFGCHPHGIGAFGPMVTFASEANGFSQLFPGINARLGTLPVLFMIPFYRDLLLSMGMCSVSRSSCNRVLSSNTNISLAIVVGGATEALMSQPGTNQLILKKRLGFLRMAIQHNVTLVPVFAFGETDIFLQAQPKDKSLGQSLRTWLKQISGISVPLFHGRGIFNYDFGLIPYRKPMTIIIGKPVPVPKLEMDQIEPTEQQVLEVQDRYVKELTDIYDKYKDVYAKDRIQDLKIIA